MIKLLQLAIWNANGLTQHIEELKAFILDKHIDILLISETHFTEKSYLKIPGYLVYHTNHPSASARGGSAIIIKNIIKHYQLNNYSSNHLQATSVSIEDTNGPLTISAIYSPPRFTIKQNQYEDYFNTLGRRFISGGDCNAKHTFWGSRITTPKGRQLLKTN